MALIVTGMTGSGKSVLRRLCNSHPRFALTEEFRSFEKFDVSHSKYVRGLRKNFFRYPFVGESGHPLWRFKNGLFLARYLIALETYRRKLIGVGEVEIILKHLFPHALVVGDVYSHYLFKMDGLAGSSGIFRAVVYRDCRDVVSCTLRRCQKKWFSPKHALLINTPQKIAKEWKKAIVQMQRYAEHLHLIRYEELVSDPKKVLTGFAHWLGVDLPRLNFGSVSSNYAGEWRQNLSAGDIGDILDVAGPTMLRLGYV